MSYIYVHGLQIINIDVQIFVPPSKFCYSFWMLHTAVCAGIYGLSVLMGNQFSTDYSATVGPSIMLSTADSREISIPIKCKKQPSSTSVGTCAEKNALLA